MKLRLDKQNNSLYFKFVDKEISESEEVKPGVILDYDKEGNIIAVEILNLSKQVSLEMLQNMQFEQI